jgi:tetratricopeptide (TPR) repeat protein
VARLIALFAFGLPAIVAAQEGKPDFAQAKKHFKSGQAFVQMERYADAVVEFKKAHAITKDDLVMGQVAMAYEKAGDYEAALAAITVYRRALPAGERASVDAMIQKYKKMIKEGRSTKLVLPGEEPVKPAVKRPDAEETPPPEPEEGEETGRRGRFYTWIAAGAAGALALSALVVGLNAQSKYDELKGTCGATKTCDPDEADSVHTRAVVADVLWGTAAAAAITAGVLFFLEGRSMEEDKRDPMEGDDEEEEPEFSQRIRISPLVGGGTYGIGAKLDF